MLKGERCNSKEYESNKLEDSEISVKRKRL